MARLYRTEAKKKETTNRLPPFFRIKHHYSCQLIEYYYICIIKY